MGRRGPLPRRRDAHGNAVESAVTIIEREALPLSSVPRPPAGLLEESVRTWRDFWTSGAATWVDRGAHMHRLIRWIRDVDTYHRVSADLRRDARRTVPGVFDAGRPWLGRGSKDQIVVHPNAELLDKLDARIHRVEVEFGMTPYAGVRLGLAGVQGALTAEQLRALIDERAGHDPAPVDADWAEGFEPA